MMPINHSAVGRRTPSEPPPDGGKDRLFRIMCASQNWAALRFLLVSSQKLFNRDSPCTPKRDGNLLRRRGDVHARETRARRVSGRRSIVAQPVGSSILCRDPTLAFHSSFGRLAGPSHPLLGSSTDSSTPQVTLFPSKRRQNLRGWPELLSRYSDGARQGLVTPEQGFLMGLPFGAC